MSRLLTGWHFMRMVRLALGILVIRQSVEYHEWVPGLLGGWFVIMALSNTGCCGANSCPAGKAPVNKTGQPPNGKGAFEEIQ